MFLSRGGRQQQQPKKTRKRGDFLVGERRSFSLSLSLPLRPGEKREGKKKERTREREREREREIVVKARALFHSLSLSFSVTGFAKWRNWRFSAVVGGTLVGQFKLLLSRFSSPFLKAFLSLTFVHSVLCARAIALSFSLSLSLSLCLSFSFSFSSLFSHFILIFSWKP